MTSVLQLRPTPEWCITFGGWACRLVKVMVKQQAPWSVRGVSKEALSKAKKAASDNHMTIGKWVSHALITVADTGRRVGVSDADTPGAMPDGPAWAGALLVEPTADDTERRDRAIRALTERRGAKKLAPAEKQRAPWSIRGVSEEARAKATKAAAREHRSVGDWVSDALLHVSDRDPGDRKPPTRAAETAAPAAAARTEPDDIAKAVDSLTRHIEESRKSEQAFASLVEHLDGLERAEQQMSELAKRFSDLDQRDNALLALSRRVVDSQSKNEQRLSALTTAISLLADRVYTSEDRPAQSGGEIDRSIASIIGALGTLAANVSGAPGAPPAPAGDDQAPDPGREVAGEAPPPPAPPPADALPKFDFDQLNEKAIENTRRVHPDAHQRAATRGS